MRDSPGSHGEFTLIVVLRPETGPEQRDSVRAALAALGVETSENGQQHARLLPVASPAVDAALCDRIRELEGVQGVVLESLDHPLASSELKPDRTVVRVEREGFEPVEFGRGAVPVLAEGALAPTVFVEGCSKAGDYVELRADMPVLAVVSNCPQVNNPCNDGAPTPIRVVVHEPGATAFA